MSEQQASKTPRQPVQLQQQQSAAPAQQMVDTLDAQYKSIGIGAVTAACIARHKPGKPQF